MAANFISMAIDLREENMVKNYLDKKNNPDDFDSFKENNKTKMTDKEVDEEFNNIDLTAFNDASK